MKIAIIGYGGMGSYHASRLKGNGILQVKGIYDIDPARQENAKKDGYYVYPSYRDIAGDDIDGVLIATPNDSHRFYVEYFAKAGKHIVCEKPATMTSSDFTAMAEAAKRAGIVFMVHQNRRWDKDFLIARDIYEHCAIGEVYRIESRVMGGHGIPGGWRKQIHNGGGMMLDWGVHLIDQALMMIPQRLTQIDCRYSYLLGFDVDDGFTLDLTFESGLIYRIVVDTNTFIPLPRWQIYGREGTAQINDWDTNGKIVCPVYNSEAELVGVQAGNGFTKTMAYRDHNSVKTLPLPELTVDYDGFYKNFAAAALGQCAPTVTSDEVLRVIRVMEGAKKSADENVIIKFKNQL